MTPPSPPRSPSRPGRCGDSARGSSRARSASSWLFEVAFLAAIVNLGVAIPSSPGFVGTYQWLCVSSLALLDVAREEGFAFSVLLHASWFVPSTAAGLALLVAGGSARALGGLRTMAEPRAT